MSAEDLIDAGRDLASELRPDTGRITRPNKGPGTVDEATSKLTRPPGDLVVEGPCRVRIPTLVQEQDVFGDVQVSTTRFVSNWAWDIPEVRIGDLVHIVSASNDPRIVDRTFRVVAVGSKSYLIYRTLGMEVLER